jgi:Trypsin-like peptidase domain
VNHLACDEIVETVRPHIVRIATPRANGTGFLFFNSMRGGFAAVATAGHVISAAHVWEEPIRLQHHASGASILTRAADRAVLLNTENDVAAILFNLGELPLPDAPVPFIHKDVLVKVGVEIGWLGFPSISTDLCFFSGRVSTHIARTERYLVDGVAIHGVSGGPAFNATADGVSMMGVVSAYVPNLSAGEPLPGLAIVTDVTEFHQMIAAFKSLDEAQAEQTPPMAVRPARATDPAPASGTDPK